MADEFICDLPQSSVNLPDPTGNTSRILRAIAPGSWEGVPDRSYKSEAGSWQNVIRRVLVGERGETPAFHLRYFEVAPGGFSTFERHHHEHVVIGIKGEGEIRIGDRIYPIRPLDVAYVAPDDPHQLRNLGEQPFGFFCIVNAERDRPVPIQTALQPSCYP